MIYKSNISGGANSTCINHPRADISMVQLGIRNVAIIGDMKYGPSQAWTHSLAPWGAHKKTTRRYEVTVLIFPIILSESVNCDIFIMFNFIITRTITHNREYNLLTQLTNIKIVNKHPKIIGKP